MILFMRKRSLYLLLVIFLFVTTITFAQRPVFFVLEGKCWEVLEKLQQQTNNDTITVRYFLAYYEVDNCNVEKLKENSPADFIDYFEKHKLLTCRSKYRKKDYPLLISPEEE